MCQEWSDMFTNRLLFQWASTIKIQESVLIWYKANIIIISSNVTCSCHDIPNKNCWFRIKHQSLCTQSMNSEKKIFLLTSYCREMWECTYVIKNNCLIFRSFQNNLAMYLKLSKLRPPKSRCDPTGTVCSVCIL